MVSIQAPKGEVEFRGLGGWISTTNPWKLSTVGCWHRNWASAGLQTKGLMWRWNGVEASWLQNWEGGFIQELGGLHIQEVRVGPQGDRWCFQQLWCCEEDETGLERRSKHKDYSPIGDICVGKCLNHVIIADRRNLFLWGHLITPQFVILFYFLTVLRS